MMEKKYLMKGATAFSMALLMAGCSNVDFDSSAATVTEEEALVNAEQALGVEIDPNQDWVMTQEVSASIDVNGDYGETYDVTIYENNPFVDGTAVVLGHGSVVSGGTANFTFVAPKGVISAFAAIKDPKGYSYVKPVVIADGKITTAFGSTTRGVADDFVVPTYSQPDFSALISDAVAITAENNTTTTSVRHYVIPAGTTWNGNIPLISASDPNDNSIVAVYVLGTLNVNSEQKINGGYGGAYQLIVGNGGVVNIASGVKLLSNANQSSGYVGEIHVLAGGTIQGEGTLEFSNGTNGYNYNAGTIDVGTLNNNGGVLYNVGTIEADVLQGGAGNSTIINQNKVTIGTAAYGNSSANLRIMNNCWWEVTGTFACRNIVQGEGAYFHAAELAMSGSADGQSTLPNSCIYAKDNSLIDITGAVGFNGVDIIGPTGANYAYLQFGSVGLSYCATNYSTAWENGVETMSVGAIQNNIRLSVDTPTISADTNGSVYNPTAYEKLLNMLNGTVSYSVKTYNDAFGQWGTWSEKPVVGNGNAVLVAKGQVTDVVSESDCTPGVVIVPPTPIVETNPIYSYAFEDTKGGDYDMNDVVLKVQENADGEIELKLVAAGATLDLEIRLYSYDANNTTGNNYGTLLQTLSYNNETEIHAMLGVDAGTMVNTGGSTTKVRPITITLSKVLNGVTLDPSKLRLAIYSETQGEIRLAGAGQAPYGVIIPIDWSWPTERTRVTNAYNNTNADGVDQSFATYASDSNGAPLWYNFATGSVMNETTLGF